jgi:hypothetical protein
MCLILFTKFVLQMLTPLRFCTHNPLTWDERYAPFIHHAGFMPLARLVTGGLPLMDSVTLTTQVDQ